MVGWRHPTGTRAPRGGEGAGLTPRSLPWRTRLAAFAGRFVALLLRLLHRGATTVPGRVALSLDPAVARRLAAALPRGAALISGTNGKTTTAALLRAALEQHGLRVAHNRGGANLRTGVAAALLRAPLADVALLEVDEATMPWAGRQLRPRMAAVTNFFRDQLDRYGELETAVALVRRGLEAMPEGGAVAFCADDPISAALGDSLSHHRPWPFGVHASVAAPGGGAPSDAPRCPRCGEALRYTVRFYAHLGHYGCSACSFRRPEPEVEVLAWLPPAGPRPGEITLRIPGGRLTAPLAQPGLYSAYNAAAAVAGALALGLPEDDVAAALRRQPGVFGRMERLQLRGHPAYLALVKNPVGCSEVLRAVLEDATPGKALALLLNDRPADGTDVSWIWDADFEALGRDQDGFAAIVAGGTRAADMALRLHYAGVTAERLQLAPDPEAAMAAAARAASPGAPVYVLPTYTALLQARAVLVRQGEAVPFWEV